MPTYSYRCTKCDNAFDIQQAFTDDTLTQCPACSGKLRKLFNTVGVTFNGSGFYRTDSRAKPSSDSGSSSSSSSTPSSSKDSGSSSSTSSTSAPAKTSTSTSSSSGSASS